MAEYEIAKVTSGQHPKRRILAVVVNMMTVLVLGLNIADDECREWCFATPIRSHLYKVRIYA
jgi:hypothetical protein